MELIQITNRKHIKALEIFTIMASTGALWSGKNITLKSASMHHNGVMIFNTNNDLPKVRGTISFESYCMDVLRPYWKAKSWAKIGLSDDLDRVIFESDLCYSEEKIIKKDIFPPFPIVTGKTFTVNFHKLKLFLEKNYVKNPKYPKVQEKFIKFDGQDFDDGPFHKTSTLYQCLVIAWRVNKIGRITSSEGWTIITAESPEVKFECAVMNYPE